jgi:hypothetical protein
LGHNLKLDLALAIKLLKHHRTSGTREGAYDLAHPAQFHQPRQANPTVARVIRDTSKVLGALFDQPFNQLVGLAHSAKATDQNS